MAQAPSKHRTLFADADPQSPALGDVALDRSPFGISLTSQRPESFGAYLFANPAYCAITGFTLEQLKTRGFVSVVHPEDVPQALAGVRRLISGEVAEIDTELRLRRRDGTDVAVRQHRTSIRDASGGALWTLTHTEDISERKAIYAAVETQRAAAESSLRESETRYRVLADHGADMIVCTRRDRSRSYVSPASQRLLGYLPAEIIDMDFGLFLHPDERTRVQNDYAAFLERGGSETYVYRLRHKDGSYVWAEAHWVKMPEATGAAGEPAPDAGNSVVVAVVRDISERKAAESKIASMASHDSLTGLANRVLLRDRLDQASALVKQGGSVALLSVDLDNFKAVNDTLGHAIGDALLKAVAERLLRCVRENDTVARLGGDEFIVVLLGLEHRDEAARRARAIVQMLSAPYDVAGHEILMSASVGVTTSPQDGTRPDVLLKNADVALYCAKSAGRRGYRLFEPTMAVERQTRLDTERELRAALAAGSLAIYYQPIVDVISSRVTGFEALVRWRHPHRGLVYPGDFITIAEETGMIVPLGESVLRGACLQAAQWPAGVRVSVNVSPVQLENAGFVKMVSRALSESGLPAQRLELEITESVLLRENDGTIAVFNALRALGVSLALDDFGTGYSSLKYLLDFRFDRIKIDRAFIGDLLRSAEAEAVVRAVAGIGTALGIPTVAEGVETHAHLARVRADGCSEAQGYLYSKARPPEDLAEMLASVDLIPGVAALFGAGSHPLTTLTPSNFQRG